MGNKVVRLGENGNTLLVDDTEEKAHTWSSSVDNK